MNELDRYTRTLQRALTGEPNPEPPPPWLGWLLVCLCRQRARQGWLGWVARTRLEDVESESGVVPGFPEWSYEFHGSGLCLSGPGNEHLDVDFHDDECATIDPFFFAGRALRLDPPPPPEKRLGELFADPKSVDVALKELRAAGVLIHESSEHVFRLAAPIEALHRDVAAVAFDAEGTTESWARALGHGADTSDRFVAWLEDRCQTRRTANALVATVEQRLAPDAARRVFERILPGPVDATTGYAAEALHRLGSEAEPLLAVLDRLDPSQHHPFPAYAVCRFLLHRGVGRARALDTAESFAAVEKVKGYVGNPYGDRLALLLLEFDPPRALPHVRRALRASTPAVVEGISATLAALGQSWCVRELTAALSDLALDQPNRRTLAAALGATGSEVAARRAEQLRPPAPEHEGPGYTFDEVVFANLQAFFGPALDRARPLADRLRSILPDDYGAPG